MNRMNDIAVVDDNPLLLCVLSEIFREHDYLVRTAPDGFAALATIRERKPDILISDLNMPGMTGFELLSIVRRKYPTIAAIAMSGAYGGIVVPAGIAADGFYAKGASSVARLLEVVDAIEDEVTRLSRRVATPIWIPALTAKKDNHASRSVACPECLRTFFHDLREDELLSKERCCPHCLHCVQLAMVLPSMEPSNIGNHLAATAERVGQTAYRQ